MEETFSKKKKEGTAVVLLFFSYSINLMCDENKIFLSDKNLLDLKCKVIYLLRDVDLYFLQILAEGLCTILYHREVCLVSTNVIEDNCSFQGFVVDLLFFFLESSLAVKHLHRRFGWAHRKPLLTLFLKQKGGTPFPQGRTKQWCFFFHLCAH